MRELSPSHTEIDVSFYLAQMSAVLGELQDGFSLLRRGVARTGEVGMVGGFLDYIGVIPQFSDIIATSNGFIGSVLTCIVASGFYDVIERITKPDLRLPPCKNEEPKLPMEGL